MIVVAAFTLTILIERKLELGLIFSSGALFSCLRQQTYKSLTFLIEITFFLVMFVVAALTLTILFHKKTRVSGTHF